MSSADHAAPALLPGRPDADVMLGGPLAGGVTSLLRLEGALLLVGATAAYRVLGGGLPLFALLFFAPDVSMLGYLANTRTGAALYNAAHTELAPAALAALGWAAAEPRLFLVALIWAAHIGFDRLLGYGLKYPEAFGATHLGGKGRPHP